MTTDTWDRLTDAAELSYQAGEQAILDQIKELLGEHGGLSTAFLMRKLGVTYRRAVELMKRIDAISE